MTSKNFELSELARKLTVEDSEVRLTGAELPTTALKNTAVTPGTYGSSTSIPVITVNSKGQITSATTLDVGAVGNFTYDSASKTLNISTSNGGSYDATLSNLATESYVNNAITTLVDSSPSTLDTLNELAAALGDDPNFATTISTTLGTKVDKINITGTTVGSATSIPVLTYNDQGQITSSTTASLDLSTKLDLSGGTITGNVNVSGDNSITFGPNSSWSKYLKIGGNNSQPDANTAAIATSSGNLHIDSSDASGSGVYINWYGGTDGFYVGNGAGGQIFRIDGSGNATASGNVTAYSDERLKTDIQTLSHALETVNALRGVAFIKDNKANIGLIAQEVQRVLPQVVQENNDGYLSIAYGNIVGLLIEAIKQLNQKVEELESKVK